MGAIQRISQLVSSNQIDSGVQIERLQMAPDQTFRPKAFNKLLLIARPTIPLGQLVFNLSIGFIVTVLFCCAAAAAAAVIVSFSVAPLVC